MENMLDRAGQHDHLFLEDDVLEADGTWGAISVLHDLKSGRSGGRQFGLLLLFLKETQVHAATQAEQGG